MVHNSSQFANIYRRPTTSSYVNSDNLSVKNLASHADNIKQRQQ